LHVNSSEAEREADCRNSHDNHGRLRLPGEPEKLISVLMFLKPTTSLVVLCRGVVFCAILGIRCSIRVLMDIANTTVIVIVVVVVCLVMIQEYGW